MSSVHDQLIADSNYATIARYNRQQAESTTTGKSGSIQSQDFLHLLTMQLQYQDPTNPMDNSEMLAQEAQFTTLEQMENLASSFTKFSSAYQANSFLGQTVEVEVDGKTTTGKVDYVDFTDASGASLSIGGKSYPISSVTKMYPPDTTQADEDKGFIKEALSYIGGNIGALTNALLGDITDAVVNSDNVSNIQGQ